MQKLSVVLLLCTVLCAAVFAQNTPAGPVNVEMIRIPGGTFKMGKKMGEGDNERPLHERPAHTVTLSAFSMSRYEVTQEQYEAIMGVNPSRFRADPACGEVQEKRPVENVTWYDAVEFCNKLSVIEGLQPVYTITNRQPSAGYPITGANVKADFSRNGYRLPTEAQWEYAAKGGNPLAAGWKGYTFSGSNTMEDVAWYDDGETNDMTHEVGKKAPNGSGLYDMSGNVSEWCWDWFGNYSSEAQTNPTGPSSGSARVIRGGSWVHSEYYGRSVDRGNNRPRVRDSSLGFRVVRP